MVLTERDNGRTVEVKAGAVISVRLAENPSTGYRWSAQPSAGLELASSNFEPGGGAPGAGGVRVLEFRAARAGAHELRLKHWREWQGESSVTGRFATTVTVK